MEQIFLAILIIIIVKYGLFTISLKKKKGLYDFFSRSYGLSKLSMHFCALPPTLPDEHHKEVADRILPIVCMCVCVCVVRGRSENVQKRVFPPRSRITSSIRSCILVVESNNLRTRNFT